MPESSQDPLESLYRAAQLVTSSADEADRLVRRVLEASGEIDGISDAGERMAAFLTASDADDKSDLPGETADEYGSASRTDVVMRAVIRRDIQRLIPDTLAILDPARRVRLAAAVWRRTDPDTHLESDATSAERAAMEAFVRLVRAGLPWRSTSLTDTDYRTMILASVRDFMEEYTEPLSPALESEVHSLVNHRTHDEERPEESAERFLQRSRRFAAFLLLVVLAALLGTWLSTSDFRGEEQPPPLLFDAIMEHVDRPADFVLQTGDSGQAERYIQDRFGWRIVAPRIDGASLEGVESEEVVPGYVLPVLRYGQGAQAPDITVFVIPYAVIQQMRGEIVVDRSVLDQIADEGAFDVVRTENTLRMAWRRLDDVYVALVSSTAPGFEDRISMP